MKKIFTFFVAIVTGLIMANAANPGYVHFKVPSDWANTISIYVWDDYYFGPEWITATQSSNGWYSAYVGADEEFNMIIVNGTTFTTDNNQTEDIPVGWLSSGKEVFVVGNNQSGKRTYTRYYPEDATKCGDNLYWSTNGDTVTITGSGAMYDYFVNDYNRNAPWGTNSTISLPAGITHIGNYAFYANNYGWGCNDYEITCSATTPPTLGENSFTGLCEGSTIYVPENSVTAYTQADGWSSYTIKADITTTITYTATSQLTEVSDYYTSYAAGVQVNNFGARIKSHTYDINTNTGKLTFRGIPDLNSNVFYGCTELKTITIPEEVTYISSEAFNGCSNLTAINIASSNQSYKSVDGVLFSYDQEMLIKYPAGKELAQYTVPSTVKYIDEYAFSDNSALTSVTIPVGVEYVGLYAFGGCQNLTSVVWNAKSAGLGGGFNGERGVFGSNVETITFGNEVEVIPAYLCEDMFNLTSITLPSSVKEIGENAFFGCTGLQSVTFGTGLKYIARNAFCYSESVSWYSSNVPLPIKTIVWNAINCNIENSYENTFSSEVESFTLGNEVKVIPAYLCKGLSKLTSVVIPNSVDSIMDYAFYNCTGLQSVTIGTNVKYIGERVFIQDTYDYERGYSTSEHIAIKKVTWNAKNCKFYNSWSSRFGTNVETFTFGNEVEAIPAYLCNGMSKLTSITLPSSVKEIGEYAFSGCTGLKSLVIPNSVTTICHRTFADCTGLSSLTIGSGVKAIGTSAFADCTGLTSIIIPSNVAEIGSYAFGHCSSLKSFEVKNSNAACGEFILNSCAAIETIKGPASLFNFPADEMGEIDYVPYTATSITVTGGELEETGCLAITKNYKRLKNLDASAATNTTLTDEAFMGCYVIEKLVLPSQLKNIPYMAVAGCKNLKSIDIPASVEEIAQSAFEDCRSIEEITFGGKKPSSPARLAEMASTSALKKIGNWAFYNAHELQHLDLPEGVEEIGDGAFYGCTYLEDLKLPSTVCEIGDNCFALCSKLKKITVTSMTPPTIYAKTFYDVERAIPVYVPDEAVDNYKDDPLWKEFDIRGGATGIKNINENGNANANRKVMRDGQLLILRDGKTYNTQGAIVE